MAGKANGDLKDIFSSKGQGEFHTFVMNVTRHPTQLPLAVASRMQIKIQ
jgi:hypothetical protein